MSYFGTPETNPLIVAGIAKFQAEIDRKAALAVTRPDLAVKLNSEIRALQLKIQGLDPSYKVDSEESEPEDNKFVKVIRDIHRYDAQVCQAINLKKVSPSMQNAVTGSLQAFKEDGFMTPGQRLTLVRTLAIQCKAVNNAKSATLDEMFLGLLEEGVLVPCKVAPVAAPCEVKLNARTAKKTTNMDILTACAQSDDRDILLAVYNNKLLRTNGDLFCEVDRKLTAMGVELQ